MLSVGTRGLFFSPLRDLLSRLRHSIPSSSKRKKKPLAPRVSEVLFCCEQFKWEFHSSFSLGVDDMFMVYHAPQNVEGS